jgi:hypothetical protein
MPGWRVRVIVSAAAIAGVCALIVVPRLHGQRPNRLSPHESATVAVDGARITITYGRPTMRGRKIYGGLVPFDRVWMPGADEATKFETSAPLQFGDFKLPAGAYTLYTLPREKSWTLIINRQTGQFHTVYPASQDLAKLPMTLETLATPLERLSIEAVPRPTGGGAVRIEWDTTRASAPFTVLR